MRKSPNKASRPYYGQDKIDQIKQIPILEVCSMVGIDVERRGSTYWCKIRDERTASTQIYSDNTFFDHGIKKKGDVIDLVSIKEGVSPGDAIEKLADAYGISPDDPRKGLKSNELSNWEYEQIGLDGKSASNNFDFDLSRQSPDWIMKTSLRYVMPLNVLKSTNPGTYEKLLRKRACPFVGAMRKDYYEEVFSQYNLARNMGAEGAFHKAVENGEFARQIKDLQNAERILVRACEGTKVKAWDVGVYDPEEDLKKILAGEIKISDFGNATYFEMKQKAEQENTSCSLYTVDFDGFMHLNGKLDEVFHSAFLKDGNIVVQYLRKDWGRVKEALEPIHVPYKQNLNDKIASAAQQRNRGRKASSSNTKRENPSKANKGKER